ncbi:MAG TPA: TonB-dependent receptor [Gemmatimonadaceae bacterium]
MRSILSLAAALAAGFAGSAEAQEPTARGTSAAGRDSAVAMPSVSVTATRNAASILTTPLAVTKLGVAELRSVNGFGLDEALSRIPGVIAQSRYGASDIRLTIRGSGARGAGDRSNSGTTRGVRILLDGFPETEPDGRTALDQLDLGAAEAIEVIRSNASSVWGNAAGGVVNVITTPMPGERMDEARVIFGEFGLARYLARMAMPLGADGSAYATFTNTSFEGWREHSSARRALLNMGAFGELGSRTRIGVFLAAANNLMHVPGPLTSAQVDADPRQANAAYLARDERRYNRSGRLGVTLDHDVDSTTSVATMMYVNPKYLQRSERNTFRDFTRYHFGGNVIGRKALRIGGSRSRVTTGIDAAYQDGAILFYTLSPTQGRGTTLTDNKNEGSLNVGAFVQDEVSLGAPVSVLLGARWDRVSYTYRSNMPDAPVRADSRDFARISPKLGVNWRVGATRSLYANVGGGIEVPAGNETDPTPGAPPALLNPLLEPIRTTSYEAGFKDAASVVGPFAVGYDVALYDIEVTNDAIPYNGGRYYMTAGRGRRQGIELGAHMTMPAGTFANVALAASRNRYLDYVIDSAVIAPGDPTMLGKMADYSGNEMMGIPPLTLNAEVGAPIPGIEALRVRGGVEHSSAYRADDASLVRVRGYTIGTAGLELTDPASIAGMGMRAFITLRNLTNARYIGSAFLNPDMVGGAPAAFEPGMRRTLTVSLALTRRD